MTRKVELRPMQGERGHHHPLRESFQLEPSARGCFGEIAGIYMVVCEEICVSGHEVCDAALILLSVHFILFFFWVGGIFTGLGISTYAVAFNCSHHGN